jgi:hypothetical protein
MFVQWLRLLLPKLLPEVVGGCGAAAMAQGAPETSRMLSIASQLNGFHCVAIRITSKIFTNYFPFIELKIPTFLVAVGKRTDSRRQNVGEADDWGGGAGAA